MDFEDHFVIEIETEQLKRHINRFVSRVAGLLWSVSCHRRPGQWKSGWEGADGMNALRVLYRGRWCSPAQARECLVDDIWQC